MVYRQRPPDKSGWFPAPKIDDTTICVVVEHLNLVSLKGIAQQPEVLTVFRFIAYYTDGRAYHLALTLIHESFRTHSQLEIIYPFFSMAGLSKGNLHDEQLRN